MIYNCLMSPKTFGAKCDVFLTVLSRCYLSAESAYAHSDAS